MIGEGLEPAQLILVLIRILNKSGLLNCEPKQGQAATGRTLPENTRPFARRLINTPSREGKTNKEYHLQFTLDAWSDGDPHQDPLITVWIPITPRLPTEPRVVRRQSRNLSSRTPATEK